MKLEEVLKRKEITKTIRAKMQKLQKDKEAIGEEVEEAWQEQFDKVMTMRAYDLLYLEYG